jgi:beta-glucosidase
VVFASNLLSEGADATSLYLQGGLNALISAVAAVNPRTVVVLNTGGPILMPWKSKVEGIVEAWYGGQMSGPAIAQVLTGVVDPSGRLPVTMPASPNQTPATSVRQYPGVNGLVNFGGLSDLGYRWYQTHSVTPAFAFGYGLSYTSFHWSNIIVVSGVPGGGSTQRVTHGTHGSGATVSLTVTNTGPRDGASVVQVYVSYPARLGEPPEQLRGFVSVDLAPGASKNVVITLPTSAFSYFNGRSMAVAPGSYGVNVATSSANIVASQSLNVS